MKVTGKRILWCVLMMFIIHITPGQSVNDKLTKLTVAEGVYVDGIDNDWLVSEVEAPAGVFRNEKGNEIMMSNGIVSRSFRITPNAATISLKNLTEQEELIRAVEPEAVITIDGYSMEVGGLEGQPNLAFLYPDWIDGLKANPLSFQFYDFTVGKPKKRFDWAKVRHHAPGATWPLKGVHLKMDYRLDDIFLEDLLSVSQQSGIGRRMLFQDDFSELSTERNTTVSTSHPRSSFINEGKPGEIYTPNNTVVCADYTLPKGTGLVETSFNSGTDLSGAWGPGIALVWKDRILKFNVRPGNESGMKNKGPWKFTVFDGKKVNTRAGGKNNIDLDQTWQLRLRIDDTKVYCEAKPIGGEWFTVEVVDFEEKVADPLSARIGKLGRKAEGNDHEFSGDLVRLTFSSFTAYSHMDQAEIDAVKVKLEALKGLSVSVNYELYDGIPVFSKWVDIQNSSKTDVKVEKIVSEYLGLADHDPYPGHRGHPEYMERPNIHLETNFAFSAGKVKIANSQSVHWEADQDYVTQISWNQTIPNLVKVYPENGYNVKIEPGGSLESIRAFLLPYDSFDKERKGLSLRKMYRTVAPWITENPLMFHVTRSKWDEFTMAVDQAAEVGYEMVNFSFGSGFNPEDDSRKNLDQMKKYADYAQSKGIGIGTYSLLASRSISEKDDVINPKTGRRGGFATFGNSPCLAGEWGLNYFEKLYNMFEETGFLTFTHDGNYPGDICASTTHPGHIELGDSQFKQWKIITDFYKWCKGKGVYLRVPDYYFLTGSNQNGVGYRENNWSLPRRHQLIHTRQNIFDGTWESTPSMRWSFIPLAQYHGGGAAATIEPLNDHLDHYEMMLVSNIGMGIQSALRGPRLYDTDKTKFMVKRVVAWYKKYRDILESDVIHVRRADGRDIDYMLHANPQLKEKGMLMVFNPTDQTITKKIKVPLYYTGLSDEATIREREGKAKSYRLNREYEVEIEVTVQPNWYNWYVVE